MVSKLVSFLCLILISACSLKNKILGESLVFSFPTLINDSTIEFNNDTIDIYYYGKQKLYVTRIIKFFEDDQRDTVFSEKRYHYFNNKDSGMVYNSNLKFLRKVSYDKLKSDLFFNNCKTEIDSSKFNREKKEEKGKPWNYVIFFSKRPHIQDNSADTLKLYFSSSTVEMKETLCKNLSYQTKDKLVRFDMLINKGRNINGQVLMKDFKTSTSITTIDKVPPKVIELFKLN